MVREKNQQPHRVYLAPDGQELHHKVDDGYITIYLPPIGVYSVVVIEPFN